MPEPSVDKPLAPPPEPAPSIEPIIKFTGAFATPESVLYDAAADRYLVSNVNGSPRAGRQRLHPGAIAGRTGDEPQAHRGWSKQGRLDAPKGLAIVGTELWVADITLVRSFDLKSSAHKADIQLPGATFANDIVAAPDGGVLCLRFRREVQRQRPGSIPGRTRFLHRQGRQGEGVAKSKELGGPNGLALGVANTIARQHPAGRRSLPLTR